MPKKGHNEEQFFVRYRAHRRNPIGTGVRKNLDEKRWRVSWQFFHPEGALPFYVLTILELNVAVGQLFGHSLWRWCRRGCRSANAQGRATVLHV